MKTFEEAFEIVTNKKALEDPKLMANMETFVKESILVQRFKIMIETMASQHLLDVIYKRQNPNVSACNELHISFIMGLLVGMEMEKNDESTNL